MSDCREFLSAYLKPAAVSDYVRQRCRTRDSQSYRLPGLTILQSSPPHLANAIAVIPARAGSKRIAQKSIRDFCGKPMIAYAIEAARQSGLFSRIVVSTDSEVIAEHARDFGAEAPFIRPAALAGDHVATQPVIKHAIETLNLDPADSTVAFAVCCIYPSVPFLVAADLCSSYRRLNESPNARFVFSVTAYDYPVSRALTMDDPEGGVIKMVYPQHELTRSQDLPHAVHDAGQYYWGWAQAWCDGVPLFSAQSIGQPMPRYRAIDIDTPEDWRMAELIYRAMALDPDVEG